MIFFLDANPTRCASFHALGSIPSTLLEVVQALCDTTRQLIEDCSVHALEKKMRDERVDARSDFYAELLRNVPMHATPANRHIVEWASQGQDAWDWLLEFATDLRNEQKNWTAKGPNPDIERTLNWVRVNAPQPLHAGRVLPRRAIFPLDPRVRETDKVLPGHVEMDRIIWTYRALYRAKYSAFGDVYAKARRPWWWDDHMLVALASARATG